MFWFDKHNADVEFCDIRESEEILCDGRKLNISPDTIADFTNLPFSDNTFWHVVFDPPHLTSLGKNSWMAKKYGVLGEDWTKMLHYGFSECMRVLKPNGTLIFKWNEQEILVSKILSVIGYNPLYVHKSGKRQKTHWMAFIKDADSEYKETKRKENGCKDCPVNPCETAIYRGSTCASQRAKYGLGDPEV